MLGFIGHTSRARQVITINGRILPTPVNAGFRSLNRISREHTPIERLHRKSSNVCRHFHVSSRAMQTHYEILGLAKTATTAEIKKAYRTKAKQYHPDTNKEPNAQAKFVAVKEAYECLKDPARRSYYDSTLSGSTSSRNSAGFTRNANYQGPQWDFRQAERKMWEDMKSHRYSRRSEWQKMHKEMNDEMRRSEEHEALRKMLSPYFNAALVISLIALGLGSLYLQFRNRGNPGHVRSFSSKMAPPEHPGSRGTQKEDSPRSILEESTDYHTIDPHRKYYTRWDEINEAVKRRDDFYRALLRPENNSDSKNQQWSKPTL